MKVMKLIQNNIGGAYGLYTKGNLIFFIIQKAINSESTFNNDWICKKGLPRTSTLMIHNFRLVNATDLKFGLYIVRSLVMTSCY